MPRLVNWPLLVPILVFILVMVLLWSRREMTARHAVGLSPAFRTRMAALLENVLHRHKAARQGSAQAVITAAQGLAVVQCFHYLFPAPILAQLLPDHDLDAIREFLGSETGM